MNSYISFRNVRTDDLGLCVAKGGMPSHKKAKQRYTEYEIPGRNGAVHILDGYSPYDLKAVLMMLDATASMRQAINAWADGTGELYTSDDVTRVWKASVLREVQYGRQEYNGFLYDTATITFRCQPIMRERTPQVITLTAAGTLTNLGNVEAYPKIIVKGEGECTVQIGDTAITLQGVTSPVTIDCEAGYMYSTDGNVTMVGEFPVLDLGETDVSFGGGCTGLEITPNWGWI